MGLSYRLGAGRSVECRELLLSGRRLGGLDRGERLRKAPRRRAGEAVRRYHEKSLSRPGGAVGEKAGRAPRDGRLRGIPPGGQSGLDAIPVTTSIHVVFLMFISIVLMILTQRKILEGVGELAYIQKHPSLRRKCLRVWKLIWLFVILTLFGEQMARFFEGSVRYIITVGFALCALIFQFIAAGYVISGYDLVEQSNKES